MDEQEDDYNSAEGLLMRMGVANVKNLFTIIGKICTPNYGGYPTFVFR